MGCLFFFRNLASLRAVSFCFTTQPPTPCKNGRQTKNKIQKGADTLPNTKNFEIGVTMFVFGEVSARFFFVFFVFGKVSGRGHVPFTRFCEPSSTPSEHTTQHQSNLQVEKLKMHVALVHGVCCE